ncbi:hypothetical protein FACS189432_03150 [Bacteroidia bacterium]|nr:hypothetical protein FACS189432_03150 [Bacteroidia bacterium]
MPKSHYFFYILLISLLTSFFACNEDFEDYSTNPQNLLAFSTDTLSFDTVLTTVNSPIQALKVYNPNSKPLLISSLNLASGTDSGFKINVDGFAGSSFQDIEIGANDSIYIFVDVKPKENGKFIPSLLNDHIVFITNGVQQQVVLEAYGQDIFKWKGVILASDSVLSNEKPFLIYDSLVIEEGVSIEIQAGTTFYMYNNAQLIVKGNLKIHGTVENPVTFRGSRTDNMLDISYDKIPGQWGGIRFASNSYENEFENVSIRNGKFGMDFELSDPSRNKITMKNVMLTNVSGALIHAVNCDIIAENCEFSNAKNAILHLTGGSCLFTHCTLANFYPYAPESGWLNSDNETLIITDAYYSEENTELQYFPVLKADFLNTIIWGGKLPASSVYIEANPQTPIPYFFRNCLLPNKNTNDAHYTDCLFQTDPLFRDMEFSDTQTDGKKVYATFDFSLQEQSPARNIANPDISKNIPYDIKGFYRFTDGQPDLGAYEFNK